MGFDTMSKQQHREISRRGGVALAESMTPEERSERGRIGAAARHASMTPERRAWAASRAGKANLRKRSPKVGKKKGSRRKGKTPKNDHA